MLRLGSPRGSPRGRVGGGCSERAITKSILAAPVRPFIPTKPGGSPGSYQQVTNRCKSEVTDFSSIHNCLIANDKNMLHKL